MPERISIQPRVYVRNNRTGTGDGKLLPCMTGASEKRLSFLPRCEGGVYVCGRLRKTPLWEVGSGMLSQTVVCDGIQVERNESRAEDVMRVMVDGQGTVGCETTTEVTETSRTRGHFALYRAWGTLAR